MTMDYKIQLSDLSYAYIIIKNDKKPTICYGNLCFYNMLGYDEQDFLIKNGQHLSPLLEVNDFLHLQSLLDSNKNDFTLDLPIKGKQEVIIWNRCNVHKLKDSDDVYCMVFYNIQDFKEIAFGFEDLKALALQVLEFEEIGILLFRPESGYVEYCYTDSFIVRGECKGNIFPNVFLESNRVHPNHIEIVKVAVESMKDAPLDTKRSCDVQFLNMQNEYVWIRLILSKHVYYDRTLVFVVLSDINAEKDITFKYVEQTMFYQSMLSSQEAYAHVDLTAQEVRKVGGKWNMYIEAQNTITYSSLFEEYIHKMVFADDRERFIEICDEKNLYESYKNGILELEFEYRRTVNQDSCVWMVLSIQLFENAINKHIMALIYTKNIDDQKRQNTTIVSETYDELTRLYDRKTLEYQVSNYLSNLDKNEIGAFILCNINSIRRINAVYGFHRGDEVLLDVSNILSMVFRKRDILGRFENDKFIIILKDMNIDSLKDRINSMFSYVQQQEGEGFYTLSLGVVYIEHGDSFVNSLKQASMALQVAKEKAGNHYEVFNMAEFDDKKQQSGELQFDYLTHGEESQNSNNFDRLAGKQGDMAYIVDPETYELLEGNQSFYDRLDITKEACKGRTCYDILHERTTPCTYCQKNNWSTEKFYSYKNYNEVLRKDFLIKNKLVNWRGEIYLFANAIEIEEQQFSGVLNREMAEDNCILNGIRQMQKGTTLQEVMESAMETIATFFRADACRCWCYNTKNDTYDCKWMYASQNVDEKLVKYNDVDLITIRSWFKERKWVRGVSFDNQETMIFEDYDMYQLMDTQHITNVHWHTLFDNDKELAIFEIDNVHTNFDNTTFLQNFLTFIVNEWNRCSMIQNILYTVKFDALTGLLNRTSYETFLCEYDPDVISSVAVVSIDINGLSNINSLKGSDEGDLCLQALGEIISETFHNAQNYRLGADEFECIWMNTESAVIEKQINEIRKKIEMKQNFSVSIGYAWDDIEKDIKSMIEYALQSMHVDKINQKNKIDDIMNIDFHNQQNMLINRIDKGDYLIYLQPKVNAKNGSVVGAEALIRRYDDARGIIPPSEYVPQLESNGLIRYIDLYVYEEVCRLISKWIKQGKRCPTISLNFSRVTMMEQNLINIMDNIVEKYDTPKKYIEIEITESYADVGKALLYQSARQIHEAGFSVALDDFGTNFTNLSILSDIHVDVLKIDKSLIHSMKTQEKNLTVLKHIIDMCKDLNICVIAEGVDHMDQRNALMEMGCNLIQGYLFSRPIDILSFEKAFLPRVSK